MGQPSTEQLTFCVESGEGSIIGDTLRKYATRSIATWQIAGFFIDTQSTNFGFSSGPMVSYLELLKGRLVCNTVPSKNEPFICNFTWNGSCFSSGDFEIHGLNRGVGDTLVVCLVYARGNRTAEQNLRSIASATGGSTDGYFAVPSSHSVVSTFRYKVEPLDDNRETLSIEADHGVVGSATKELIRALSSLG